MYDYTICTVNYNTESLLDLNIRQLLITNGGFNINITENSPFKTEYDKVKINLLPPINQKLAKATEKNLRPHRLGQFLTCNHHSMALNSAIQHANSRFIILYDADFFLRYPIEPILKWMDANNIAVYGTPYGHVSSHKSIEQYNLPSLYNYPAIFFLVIDKNLVKVLEMDPRLWSQAYCYSDNSGLTDTPYSKHVNDSGLPTVEQFYKIKYKSATVCVNQKCNICNNSNTWLNIRKLSNNLEIYYLNNKIFGFHMHTRLWGHRINNFSPNMGSFFNDILQINNPAFHPRHNYIL